VEGETKLKGFIYNLNRL